MSLTLAHVEQFLLSRELAFRREPDQIIVGFATRLFRDEQGRAGVAIAVRIDEAGSCLEMLAPGLYNSRGCRHPAALFEVLLDITMQTRLIRFEHDASDGEVRCAVECPIEDGTLTARQFHRLLGCLAESIDRWHPAIRRAMDTGRVSLDVAEPVPAPPVGAAGVAAAVKPV